MLLLGSTFFGVGAWPIVIDGALARVAPDARAELAVAWNLREYAAMAATTFLGGFLYDAADGPSLLLLVVALLMAAATVAATAVLGRDVYAPSTT